MDKLKSILNPGHRELDELLYDTGDNSHNHSNTRADDTATTDKVADPKVGNNENVIPDRTVGQQHGDRDTAIGAGARPAGAVQEHNHHNDHPAPTHEPQQHPAAAQDRHGHHIFHRHKEEPASVGGHDPRYQHPATNDQAPLDPAQGNTPQAAVGAGSAVAAVQGHNKLHKQPSARQQRTSDPAHDYAAVGAVGHQQHQHRQQPFEEQRYDSGLQNHGPQTTTGAVSSHDERQLGHPQPLKPHYGDEIGAVGVLSAVPGNVKSSSASYASNASVKSGVPGRAPGMRNNQPLSGLEANDKELPSVPHTDGKFMNDDFARDEGYPNQQTSASTQPHTIHHAPAALTGAGATAAAYALHEKHEDGHAHETRDPMTHDESGTSALKRSDTGPASKTIGPHKSNILNILDPRVQPVPALMKGKRGSGHSEIESDSKTRHEASEPHEAMGVGNTHDAPEHRATSSDLDNTAESPVSPTSSKSVEKESTSKPAKHHKHAILNLLDPRVKKSKSDKADHAAESEETTPKDLTESGESPGHEQGVAPTSLVGAANGGNSTKAEDVAASPPTADHADRHPVAKGVNPTQADQTIPPMDTTPLAASSSGAGLPPKQATAANAADGKGGIITGEKAKVGDRSNPYSATPLDPRIDMPGMYPTSPAG